MNRKHHLSGRIILYSYFIVLILLGSVLLALPLSWGGLDGTPKVALIDAVFTAVSAACVTGLITIDTSLWSRFGQSVILFLIQSGGLGISSFAVLYLVLPRLRISIQRSRMLRESFVSGARLYNVRSIIMTIILTTLLIEGMGWLILAVHFKFIGVQAPLFSAAFHAVSAFCNAGFSLFSDGLMGFRGDLTVNLTLMFLIICGGIGFMVIGDIRRKIHHPFKPLLFYTRFMLIATAFFILLGVIGYYLLDTNGLFSQLPPGERIMALFFQSITTRTAGFNTVDQAELSLTSRWLTLLLMLIGGGSGSTAGGIKVSTAFILLLILFRGMDESGDLSFMRRRIPAVDVSRAAMFFLKALAILFTAVLLLALIENPKETGLSISDIVFESVSALGTVGLSTGITGQLSFGGKLIIALTMFTGRVGLFSMVIRSARDRTETLIEYPKGEVLIG